MATVMIADFSGMRPLRDPILLPDTNAQYSENAWLYRGAVRGFRVDAPVYNIKYNGTKQVFRIPNSDINPPDFINSTWMEFPDPYMAVIRNPTVGDTWNRYYFFPSSEYQADPTNPMWTEANPGPVYNTLDRIQAGDPMMIIGVPQPSTAPTITAPPYAVTKTAVNSVAAGSATLTFSDTTNIYKDMVASDLTSTALSKNTNAATTVNGTTLHFLNTTGIYIGMVVADLTTTEVTQVTTSATPYSATPNNVLNFANTTGIPIGATVSNLTDPSGIIPGTKVAAVTATTVTLDVSVSYVGVASGATIQFETKDAIPNGTTVTKVTVSTIELDNPVESGGVLSGDLIQFTAGQPIISGSTVKSLDSTTVTLNENLVNAGVIAGDVIQFVGISESRAYSYTMVTAYGEESPPSPATVGTGYIAGQWVIVIPKPDAGINNRRNIVNYRLYRTVTDTSGGATYYQVAEVPVNWDGTTTINDSATDASITGNLILSTINYAPPPSDLEGVVMMANGIAAGFSNKRDIWFSAAYLPHAWPGAFALTVDYPIVGLTANSTSLNIMTEGSPSIATGVTPDTMTIGKVVANEPCIGRGSIVAAGEGAYYASPNGYILLNTSGTTNVTEGIFEKEFWYTLQPNQLVSGRYALSLACFIKGSAEPTINGAIIDYTDANVPFTYINTAAPVINALTDELSGQLFYITNRSVYQWNPPAGGSLWPYIWKSKKFRFTFPQQFKAFMVLFDIPPEVNITLGQRNTDQNQIYNPATQLLIVRVYGEGKQLVVREIQRSGEVLLIPGGSKWEQLEFQFEGQIVLKFFKSATSVKELKSA